MADQPAMPSDTQRPERGNRGGPRNRGRGGNRRGRGNANPTNSSQPDNITPIDQESRRGRGGGGYRGRGGRGGQFRGQQPLNQPVQPQPIDTTAQPTSQNAAGEQQTATNDSKDASSPTDSENEEICFICANPIQYHSIAPCNHMTCHICSLRMRALYKTKQCPHCRTNSDFVIFTTNATKTYEEYSPEDIAAQDDPLGIKYEAKQIREDTLVLLRYNCPEPSCDVACLGWPDLHRHVKSAHKLFLCDLCSRFKKVFTHEHTLFTYQALKKHERHGDDVPGAEDQSGFKGHPECEFCHKRFYGDDELYAHCKEAHERCFICDRNNGGRRPQYFINWEALEAHFVAEHYRCTDPECLEKKFIVFGSEMDLKAHLIEEHPGSLSKGALKDMRRVDMAAFPDAHAHGSGGGGPSRGRGGRAQRDNRRDTQAPEPPPPPTPPAPGAGAASRYDPTGRGTLYVQSASSSIPQRVFSRHLTRTEAPQDAPPTGAGQTSGAASSNTNDLFPPLSALSISSPPEPLPTRPAAVPTNVPASTAQKHEAVINRAMRLANNDNSKLEKFKRYISNYNAEQMSSKDLIEAFWVLFDVRATDLATLLRELSELFDKEEKRRSLLEAWNEWKSVNEDYPPMPGGSSSAGGSTSAARVLKLKSATNRNLHAGASPWSSVTSNTISTGAGSLANINGGGTRVGMGASAVTAAGKGKAPAAGSAPWLSAVRNQGQPGSSSGAARARAAAGGVVNKMDFPSLPKVAPKHPPVPRKNEGAAPSSVWGAAAGGSGSNGNAGDDAEGDGVKTKGKGKKKQTIIQWG
ncbi:hypothetical protein TWF696_007666 [Orbilia brochopaga]|uniref:RING-type E3 ubiquitin transferase n=1 Tax=Orbilia brochopaga TaxID=3140254 RepID=A0AAV9UKU1_9PEZI